MIIKPTRKNVLVAENAVKHVSAGGLILDGAYSTAQSKTATVLAIGPEVTEVNVGDVIYLEWNKGQIVTIDGSQRVMINEKDIVAVVDK